MRSIAYYQHRAEEMRTIAQQMQHCFSRRQLLSIADDYDRMADDPRACDQVQAKRTRNARRYGRREDLEEL